MGTPTLPRYFLAHRLPDGTLRYAYPRRFMPGGDQDQRSRGFADTGADWTWTFISQDGPHVDVVQSGAWFVSPAELATVSRWRPGPKVRDGWKLKERAHDPESEAPVMPELVAQHDGLPDSPEESWLEHYTEHQATHACWECRRFVIHYGPRYVSGPDIVEHRDLTDVQELDAPMPPAIDPTAWRWQPKGQRSTHWSSAETKPADPVWFPADTSRTAIYGAHTAHLWPGRLTGFRSAVAGALAAHPLVSEVEDRTDSTSSHWERGVHVTIHVPWETHRVREKWEKETPRSRTRKRQVLTDVWAITHRTVIQVPEALEAGSLQEALDSWDDAVEAEVDRVFPVGPDAAACDHCQGTGVTRRSGERTVLKASGRG